MKVVKKKGKWGLNTKKGSSGAMIKELYEAWKAGRKRKTPLRD